MLEWFTIALDPQCQAIDFALHTILALTLLALHWARGGGIMKIRLLFAGVIAGALFVASTVTPSAASPLNPAVSFTGLGTDFNNGGGPYSLGFEFSTNAAIAINQLGIFDDGTGAGSVNAVGIFDSSGNLLASADITQGSNYSNFFDWAPITTLDLSADTDYYIAEETGSVNYSFNNTGFLTNPDITFVESAYTDSGSLAFPGTLDSSVSNGYFGPNFSIASATAVPEPSSFVVLLTSLGLIGGAMYLGRKKMARVK